MQNTINNDTPDMDYYMNNISKYNISKRDEESGEANKYRQAGLDENEIAHKLYFERMKQQEFNYNNPGTYDRYYTDTYQYDNPYQQYSNQMQEGFINNGYYQFNPINYSNDIVAGNLYNEYSTNDSYYSVYQEALAAKKADEERRQRIQSIADVDKFIAKRINLYPQWDDERIDREIDIHYGLIVIPPTQEEIERQELIEEIQLLTYQHETGIPREEWERRKYEARMNHLAEISQPPMSLEEYDKYLGKYYDNMIYKLDLKATRDYITKAYGREDFYNNLNTSSDRYNGIYFGLATHDDIDPITYDDLEVELPENATLVEQYKYRKIKFIQAVRNKIGKETKTNMPKTIVTEDREIAKLEEIKSDKITPKQNNDKITPKQNNDKITPKQNNDKNNEVSSKLGRVHHYNEEELKIIKKELDKRSERMAEMFKNRPPVPKSMEDEELPTEPDRERVIVRDENGNMVDVVTISESERFKEFKELERQEMMAQQEAEERADEAYREQIRNEESEKVYMDELEAKKTTQNKANLKESKSDIRKKEALKNTLLDTMNASFNELQRNSGILFDSQGQVTPPAEILAERNAIRKKEKKE